jgi:hypothetical protein
VIPVEDSKHEEMKPALESVPQSNEESPMRLSGSTETKTYSKGATGKEREEQWTLPRRNIFGKDLDARSHVFNTLHVLLSPPEALFSGKWSCTVMGNGVEHNRRSQLHWPKHQSAST